MMDKVHTLSHVAGKEGKTITKSAQYSMVNIGEDRMGNIPCDQALGMPSYMPGK